MGDHQDCHGILCILHILYPEVPNRGPGNGVYSHRMDACTNFFFQVFFSHVFFLRLKACSNFFGGFLQPPPQISNGPSLMIGQLHTPKAKVIGAFIQEVDQLYASYQVFRKLVK